MCRCVRAQGGINWICQGSKHGKIKIKIWRKKKINGGLPVFELKWEMEVKGKSHSFLFFSLFHLFRQSPLKIFKSKLQPLHPPSHREHHTTVLLTRCPTRWWGFYLDWMSLIRMISYHGYQNYLPTIFKAILRPLQPTSQDKTHTTVLPRRCPTRSYEYHGHWSRFPN